MSQLLHQAHSSKIELDLASFSFVRGARSLFLILLNLKAKIDEVGETIC